MNSAELLSAQVDISGLMTVLGENLYSTPSVALRELVQNSHDACMRRQLESKEPFSPRIIVSGNEKDGTLIIDDNGAGLTREEIIQYLATIGSGYTRKLRTTMTDSSLIGFFGLGFLSAYVVSQRLSVWTTSYQSPNQGWLFNSKNGERYTIESADPKPVGMRVTLYLKEKFRHFAQPEVLHALLSKYCCLLPLPVHCGSENTPAINAVSAPWKIPAGQESDLRLKKLKLDFVQTFETSFAPICTIDIDKNSELCKGILWIQDGLTYGSSDNRNVAVFIRGMLISNDARELLPRWAGFIGGIIESDRLVPTASREDLMTDQTYSEVQQLLNQTLIDGLAKIARTDSVAWRRTLVRHNESLLGAALCNDQLFDLLANELTIPTTEGDLTLAALKERSPGKVMVSLSLQGSFEEVLFRALKVPVAQGARYAVLPFLKQYAERYGLTLVQLGTKEGNRAFFKEVSLDNHVKQWLETILKSPKQKLVATRFQPIDLPLVVVKDREVELKKRIEHDDADKRIASAALGLARLYTNTVDGDIESQLYVNLDSPVIQKLMEQQNDKGHQAGKMLKILAVLLSHTEQGQDPNLFQQTLKEYGQIITSFLEQN